MLTALEDRTTPSGTPTVSIAAGSDGSEDGAHATFQVTLSEPFQSDDPNAVLVVAVSLSGQAGYGSDYGGFYTCWFYPGAASAAIDLTPADDAIVEGAETIVAEVSGHDPNSGSPAYAVGSGGPVSVVVHDNDKASTSTGLGVSWVWPEDSEMPTALTMSATVTLYDPGAATLSGTVTFSGGGASLGTVTINGAGTATLTAPSPGLGAHNITATYNGNSLWWPSTSAETTAMLSQEAASPVLGGEDGEEFITFEQGGGGELPPTSGELTFEDFPVVMEAEHAAYTAGKHLVYPTFRTTVAAVGAPYGSTATARSVFVGPVGFKALLDAANSYVVAGNENNFYLLTHEKLHLQIAEYLAAKAAANMPPMTGSGAASVAVGGRRGRGGCERPGGQRRLPGLEGETVCVLQHVACDRCRGSGAVRRGDRSQQQPGCPAPLGC